MTLQNGREASTRLKARLEKLARFFATSAGWWLTVGLYIYWRGGW